MRILVTGAGGFVGRRLVPSLRNKFPYSHIYCWTSQTIDGTICHLIDIRDSESVRNAVREAAPTHVVHLAAVTHVPSSFEDPRNTWETNVWGTRNILDACLKEAPSAFFLYISSSEVYGHSFRDQTACLDEKARIWPVNPYGSSKAAAEASVLEFAARGLFTFSVRPFNHIGPGQSPDFVISSFARQIAAIMLGKQAPIVKVGNLKAKRDFLDVQDVVNAYCRVLERFKYLPKGGALNICSGKPMAVGYLLELLLSMSGREIAVERDPTLYRPVDMEMICGNPDLARRSLGWKPVIDIRQSLKATLDYWLSIEKTTHG